MFEGTNPPAQKQTPWPILPVIFALYVIISAAAFYFLETQLVALGDRMNASESALRDQIAQTHKELRSSASKLTQQVGDTEEKLSQRALELAAQERRTQQTAAQLADSQKQQAAQIETVSSNVSGVQSEVGAVKVNVSKTQTDLAITQARLEHTIGDLGLQSGLVATTRGDLEILKHKGDRNYYEFILSKSNRPTPVSTVSLQLRKADPKRGKYTLNVIADDKKIEKKDRNMNEPLQFYTGRDKLLYELVVFTVEKNRVSGYIATPKNAPVPVEKGN